MKERAGGLGFDDVAGLRARQRELSVLWSEADSKGQTSRTVLERITWMARAVGYRTEWEFIKKQLDIANRLAG